MLESAGHLRHFPAPSLDVLLSSAGASTPQPPSGMLRRSLWTVVRDTTAQFAADTSWAGLNIIGRSGSRVRRVFWMIVWLVALAVTLRELTLLTMAIHRFPVNTQVSVDQRRSVRFPAVTVCNQNIVMCGNLLDEVFRQPTNYDLLEMLSRSFCAEHHVTGKCDNLWKSAWTFGVSAIPEDLRHNHCFSNTTDICCQLSQFGDRLGVNVTTMMMDLSCECYGGEEEGDGEDGEEEEDEGDFTPGDSAAGSSRKKRQLVEGLVAPVLLSLDNEQSGEQYRGGRVKRDSEDTETSAEDYEDIQESINFSADEVYNNRMEFFSLYMSLPTHTRVRLGHSFNNIIKDCSYNGRDCTNPLFFRQMNTAVYGNCYVFNGKIATRDPLAGVRRTRLTGADYGLSLTLFLDVNQYMPASMSQTVGARVVIHNNDVSPTVAETGIDISPQSLTSVSLAENVILRQPAPYPSKCITTWTHAGVAPATLDLHNQAYLEQRYTMAECERICLQLRFVAACRCHHPLYPQMFTTANNTVLFDVGRPCNLTFRDADSNCTLDVINGKQYLQNSEQCSCSPECREVDYSPQTSVSSWPQGVILSTLLKDIQFVTSAASLSAAQLDRWAWQFTKLRVYFRQTSSSTISQVPTYQESNIITSLGGALSLYMGLSIIMVVELVEFIFLLVYNIARHAICPPPTTVENLRPPARTVSDSSSWQHTRPASVFDESRSIWLPSTRRRSQVQPRPS